MFLYICLYLCCVQVFGELEEVGKTHQEDVMDAGPVHGEMQGDISQCPYHAAKTGKHDHVSTIHTRIPT